MEPLNPSAQKIQNLLRGLGYDFKVSEFAESTRTAQEAADRVGCQLGQIVKSLIFKGIVSNKGILVLTSGSNRVDENKISQYTGESIGRADPEFVRTMTGFAIGGVPPLGHDHPLETYIDEDLLQYTNVWAAAGTPNAVFQLLSTDLNKITGGIIVRVKPE
jgi:prolyl-tRNA editing enzyme YbaK/EbsC (Cys-tRNA(Pro) deacylase)